MVSCGRNNYFDRWPGQRLNSFPAELQGNFKVNINFLTKVLKFSATDSILLLTIDNNSIHEIDKNSNFENVLGDSLVLSKLGNYYVLSTLKADNKGYWTIGYFKVVKNGLHYSHYMGAENVKSDHLAKYLNFVAVYKSGRTSINTLPMKEREQFYSYHQDTINYYEMNDNQFLAYIEKESPQMMLKFNRIAPKKIKK
jgi:hypothetical protein